MIRSAMLLILVLAVLAPATTSGLLTGNANARLLDREMDAVKPGSIVPIRYRAAPGLKPELDVYDAHHQQRVRRLVLPQVDPSGVYETRLLIDAAWGLGEFTIIVSEPGEGTLDSMVMTVLAGENLEMAQALAGIQTRVSAVDQRVVAAVQTVREIQSLVRGMTQRLGAAHDTLDHVLLDQRSGPAPRPRHAMDGIERDVAPVIGQPSDTAAAITAFGTIARLRPMITSLSPEVITDQALRELKEQTRVVTGLVHGAQTQLGLAASSTQQAASLLDQMRQELGAEGKPETFFEMAQRLARAIHEVRDRLSAVPQAIDLVALETEIRTISLALKQLTQGREMGLETIHASLESYTNNIDDMGTKISRLQMLLDLQREMLVKAVDRLPQIRPVIKTWLEPGSVIVKILVANPSSRDKKTVPVKAYLPKRVTPKDLKDLNGLKISRDAEKDLYFVHGDFVLGPGELVIKAVEIQDIWLVPEKELAAYATEAKARAGRLGNTPSAAKASGLASAIDGRVVAIVKQQDETTALPDKHIQAYENAQVVVGQIKRDLADLARLESVVSEKKNALPTSP